MGLANSFCLSGPRIYSGHVAYRKAAFGTASNRVFDSLQKIASSLGKYFIVVALECQPSLLRRPNLLICLGSLAVRYDLGLVSTSSGRCVYEELCLTRLVEGEEPERCFVDGLAHGEYAVVLENSCFAVTCASDQ